MHVCVHEIPGAHTFIRTCLWSCMNVCLHVLLHCVDIRTFGFQEDSYGWHLLGSVFQRGEWSRAPSHRTRNPHAGCGREEAASQPHPQQHEQQYRALHRTRLFSVSLQNNPKNLNGCDITLVTLTVSDVCGSLPPRSLCRSLCQDWAFLLHTHTHTHILSLSLPHTQTHTHSLSH